MSPETKVFQAFQDAKGLVSICNNHALLVSVLRVFLFLDLHSAALYLSSDKHAAE